MAAAMEAAMARELETEQESEAGEEEPAPDTKAQLRPLDVAVLSEPEVSERDNEAEEGDSYFMLSAEATFDGMVQGMYMHRFNKHWNTRHMILTSMEPDKSMVFSSSL
jgi:endonuclease/exonuclease/phosphatase family metal-dependent hydrolase